MSTGWKQTLLVAATAALTMAGPAEAQAQPQASIWPFQASQEVQAIPTDNYPEISPELLDEGMIGNRKMQKAAIDDAARGYAIGNTKFDLVLTTDAAYTLTRARNSGELPGAKDGQSPADWWRETEPKIFEKMAEYRAERALPFQLAGALAGGFALMVGGSAAHSAYRRRKNGQGPANDQRIDATMGGPTP